jgi:hypothetical protein
MPHRFQRLIVVALAVGCDIAPAGPETVPASGRVTQNGDPVEGAMVTFYPVEGSAATLASQAITGPDGRFDLSTNVGAGKMKSGIVAGKYAVTVTKLDIAGAKNMLAPPKNLLPKKYGDPNTSGLKAEVVAGKEGDFEFAVDGK